MCKEVALEGIAYEGGMQCTWCIWEKCIGEVCKENISDINVLVREVHTGSEFGKK